MHRLLPLLACTLFASALQGCVVYDDDDHRHGFHHPVQPAELRIYWEFAGAFGCRDAYVSDILIQIDGAGQFREFGYIDCNFQYVDIPGDFPSASSFVPGEYYVTVLGYPPEAGAGASWVAEGYVDLFSGFNEYTFGLRPIF